MAIANLKDYDDIMENSTPEHTGKLGTFAGVFTPSILTILGIILFLRMGYVVGSAGLGKALIIICIANLISVLTSFSLAAIATNMKVKGGGDYYLISRTLGLEFGGAIGIVLFLAQSVSIAFYCIGFGEAVSSILIRYDLAFSPQIIAAAALFFLFLLAFIGADLATKFQFAVMLLLTLALASFFIGGIQKWETKLLLDNMTATGDPSSFWILFALFFPAVTGFTQGVSMTGDLKSPGKSLPKGTFLAVIFSIVVYFSVALVFAASNTLDTLVTDYGAMKKTAAYGFLIDAGVISATLSSAMASFLGAPRILQSLASDKIFNFLNPFAKGYGPTNNPRRGVLLSLSIGIGVVIIGQLDLIARVVSMFFLISYGLLNYATYFEAAADSPSFRPKFRWYHKRVSLIGFLACFIVMLAIDMKTGIAASAILFAIFQYLKRTQITARWTDSRRSYHLQQIRKNLLATQAELEHPRQWRPNILIFSNTGDHFKKLLSFSEWIEGRSGTTTAVRILHGKEYAFIQRQQQYIKKLKELIAAGHHHAFPLVITGSDSETTISTLIQSFGIGPVKANTVLFDYDEVCLAGYIQTGSIRFGDHLSLIRNVGSNLIFLNTASATNQLQTAQNNDKPRIDVWWNGENSSRLVLLLAYLCTRNRHFQSAEIRLLAVNYDRDNAAVRAELSEMLDDVRIPAVPEVVLGLDVEQIVETSEISDLVFFPAGLKKRGPQILNQFDPEDVIHNLATVAMAVAASPVDLHSDPEEGPVKELTRIQDELDHAIKRAQMAREAADEAKQKAGAQIEVLKKEIKDQDQDVEKRIEKIVALTRDVTQSSQKALKERAKLDAAAKKAKDMGIAVDETDESIS